MVLFTTKLNHVEFEKKNQWNCPLRDAFRLELKNKENVFDGNIQDFILRPPLDHWS